MFGQVKSKETAYNSIVKELTPTLQKPLLGYRVWALDIHNNLLLSATGRGAAWQTGINLASGCDSHPSPGPCGYNAFYTLEYSDLSGYSGIAGAIAEAGNVFLHHSGYMI